MMKSKTFMQGLMEAVMIAEPIKSGIKFGITKLAPNSLIDSSINTISKESLNDYFSGRKTAEEIGFTPEIKNAITTKMKSMTTTQKATFLQGFDFYPPCF